VPPLLVDPPSLVAPADPETPPASVTGADEEELSHAVIQSIHGANIHVPVCK
jgi:hypothetical protein